MGVDHTVTVQDFGTHLYARYSHLGSCSAEEFRRKHLHRFLGSKQWWEGDGVLTLDFSGVDTVGPGWANEAFAFYAPYAPDRESFDRKVTFVNISPVKRSIVEREIDDGFTVDTEGEPV